jgi:hypothetical protein
MAVAEAGKLEQHRFKTVFIAVRIQYVGDFVDHWPCRNDDSHPDGLIWPDKPH